MGINDSESGIFRIGCGSHITSTQEGNTMDFNNTSLIGLSQLIDHSAISGVAGEYVVLMQVLYLIPDEAVVSKM